MKQIGPEGWDPLCLLNASLINLFRNNSSIQKFMFTDLHFIFFLSIIGFILILKVSKHNVYILGLLCQHTLKLKGSSWVEFFKLHFYLFHHLAFQRKRMPLFTILPQGDRNEHHWINTLHTKTGKSSTYVNVVVLKVNVFVAMYYLLRNASSMNFYELSGCYYFRVTLFEKQYFSKKYEA